MIPFKAKVIKSESGNRFILKGNVDRGFALKVEAVYYSNSNPSQHLRLFDADGDQFMFPVPGQARANTTSPELPVTVKLPISYEDEGEGNQVVVWGEAEKLSKVASQS